MGLMQIWRMLMARRYLILALILIGAIAGAVTAKWMPSRYEGRTRMILNVLKPDPVTGETMPTRGLETYVQAQVELIRDERVAGAVVDAFGWEQNPGLRQAYAQRSGDRELDLRSWLAKIVSDSTIAYLIPNSPILEIVYASSSADTARRGADAVREAFLTETLAMKRQEAARNATWFERQTDDLKQRLARAEARKSKFEQDNGIILQDDNVDSESAKLKALASAAPVAPITMPAAAPVSSPSAAQLATIDAQLAAARRTLGANHPDIIALQQQRAALAAAAGREMAAARAAARPAASGPSIESLVSAQSRKVLAQRGLVGQAQRLAGDVAVLRDQVAKTAQRAGEFQLQAQTTDTGLVRLGAAVTPKKPVTLHWGFFVLGGLVAGAALGVVFALLLELVFRRVRGAEDLYIEGLPVIGEMNRDEDPGQGQNMLQWLGLKKSEHQPA